MKTKRTAAPAGFVMVRHADARSCCVAGTVFAANERGEILVPAEAAAELAAHGFEPAAPAAAEVEK